MKEPSLRKSRLAVAGGLAAAILVGGGGFLLGRGTTERPPARMASQPVAAPSKAMPAPNTSRGLLTRSDLIALAASVADAVAAGRDPATEAAGLAGRRFELLLPFGCSGPADESSNAAMRWRYDTKKGALRLHVAPAVWTAANWWTGSAPAGIDSIEGFWIARPWTSSENCPAPDDRPAAVDAAPVTLPGQTLAVGQIVAADSGRDGRRPSKPYETVVRVPEDKLDTSEGFRLRITGRIGRIADAGPVRCHQPAGAEQRPICLVGIVMDEVAIENAATDETLATWTVAQREPAGS